MDTPMRRPGRDPPVRPAALRAGPPRDPRGQPWPRGCVARSPASRTRSSPARRACSIPRTAMDAIMASKIRHGDVVVIRYEGPKGGPGCRRCWRRRRRSSGRASANRSGSSPTGPGGTWGMVVGPSRPEAQAGGNDRAGCTKATRSRRRAPLLIQLNVDDAPSSRRRAAWMPPAPRYTRGLLAKYMKPVSTASGMPSRTRPDDGHATQGRCGVFIAALSGGCATALTTTQARPRPAT